MEQQLKRAALEKLLQVADINAVAEEELRQLFIEEASLQHYIPDGLCQVDPRNSNRIVFNSARSRRPHDNRPAEPTNSKESPEIVCVICDGNTTGVIDVANLSQGFTFINKNLFPMLYPVKTNNKNHFSDTSQVSAKQSGLEARGFHFLQWTSSLHNRDWHNMPRADRIVVLKRLAALEKQLLIDTAEAKETGTQPERIDTRNGYVSIIKNYGHLVGGSLVHGHQQIVFSNVKPGRVLNHQSFESRQKETFSEFMLRDNPPDLLVQDFGPAVLIVPYFMRRPFDIFLHVKDTNKQHLFQLNDDEFAAVADGWHEAIRAIRLIMPQIGKETAYNVITNNGPGTGLYFEFLPYTQETGGFEHLGLYSCQGNPTEAAETYRKIIAADNA